MTSDLPASSTPTYIASSLQSGARTGPPSRVDFELYDLVDILDSFGREWDDLPPLIPGRSDYRIPITSGVLVAAYSVQAVLNQDGVIELISLGVDLRPLPGPDDYDETD